MSSTLSLYNLGSLGVDVDKDALHLEDGELTKAQNASQDPLGGSGGLRKRQGLTKFNAIAGAGSVVGGMGVPLSYEGTLSTAIHTIYLGRWNSPTASLGWYTTTDAFATALATTITSGVPGNPAPPINENTAPGLFNGGRYAWTRPSVMYQKRMYYAGDGYTLGTSNPTIRVFDGVTDRQLTRIPYSPALAAVSRAILCMAALNNTIYLTTFDGGSSATATIVGRVFQLATDGTLTQIGAVFPTGRVPFCLTWAFGKLWVGTHAGGQVGHGTTVEVYFIRPGIDTTWTLDRTVAGANVGVMALGSYQGALYACYMRDDATTAAGFIEKRTALGVWSTVESGIVGAPSDPFHGYTAIGTFGGNLYTARYGENGESTKVRKFDGTTWSTVLTAGTGPYTLFFEHNNVFHMYGGAPGGRGVILYWTTNGTSWTSVSTPTSDDPTSAFGVIVT